MIGLDSNVLLRWIITDPTAPHQSRLVQERLEQETAPLFVNHIVLAETLWVLRKAGGLTVDRIGEIVSTLLEARNVKVQQPEIVARALESFRGSPGGFADHLIAETNLHSGCTTTLSFDKGASVSPAFTRLG